MCLREGPAKKDRDSGTRGYYFGSCTSDREKLLVKKIQMCQRMTQSRQHRLPSRVGHPASATRSDGLETTRCFHSVYGRRTPSKAAAQWQPQGSSSVSNSLLLHNLPQSRFLAESTDNTFWLCNHFAQLKFPPAEAIGPTGGTPALQPPVSQTSAGRQLWWDLNHVSNSTGEPFS